MPRNKQVKNNVGKAGKIWLLIYCLVWMVACCLPLTGLVLGLDSTNLEKRTLAIKPDVIVEGRLNLDFTDQFDAYFTDHFTFRSWLISGWHTVNQILLQRSGSSRVITGDSGWLFFQETLNDYLADPVLDPVAMNRISRILVLQQEWLKQQGITFFFMVAPNKNTIYPEKMPDRYQPVNPGGNLDYWNEMNRDVQDVDLAAVLGEATKTTDGPALYHQTDSHWNNLGAALAADALLAAARARLPGLAEENLAGRIRVPRRDWQGDLAVMLYPSGPQLDWQYYDDSPMDFKYLKTPKSLEDIQIQTSSQDGQYKLLMFRDSFANTLIPMLSGCFSEVVYSRVLPYDYRLLDSRDIDLVVLEIVERNFPQLLEYPPRMPALAVQEQLEGEINAIARPAAVPEQAGDLSIQAEYDGDWLKISGSWQNLQMLQQVDRVVVGLAGLSGPLIMNSLSSKTEAERVSQLVLYEAFPVAGPERPDFENQAGLEAAGLLTGGFTLYLKPGQWKSGSQDLELTCHDANGWRKMTVRANLP